MHSEFQPSFSLSDTSSTSHYKVPANWKEGFAVTHCRLCLDLQQDLMQSNLSAVFQVIYVTSKELSATVFFLC